MTNQTKTKIPADKVLVEVSVGWHTMQLWADMPMIKALQEAVQTEDGYIDNEKINYIRGPVRLKILDDSEYPTMDKEMFDHIKSKEKDEY